MGRSLWEPSCQPCVPLDCVAPPSRAYMSSSSLLLPILGFFLPYDSHHECVWLPLATSTHMTIIVLNTLNQLCLVSRTLSSSSTFVPVQLHAIPTGNLADCSLVADT